MSWVVMNVVNANASLRFVRSNPVLWASKRPSMTWAVWMVANKHKLGANVNGLPPSNAVDIAGYTRCHSFERPHRHSSTAPGHVTEPFKL